MATGRIDHMFEDVELDRLDAAGALNLLEHAQLARRRIEVTESLAMLRVVHTYRHQIPTDKVQLAGDGTGQVDDFACLELAAALHVSLESVTQRVVDLLNLESRLPQVWEQVVACGVPMWLARQIARDTANLALLKVRWLDMTIAPFVTRLGPGRLLKFVQALVVQADPKAADARWSLQARPRVQIGPCQPDGLRDLYGWLTAADATYLDAALEQLSGILSDRGSTESAETRRATALGILATPARALALIQQSSAQPMVPELDGGQARTFPEDQQELAEAASHSNTVPEEQPRNEAVSRRAADPEPAEHGPRSPWGCTGHTCGSITVPPDSLLPKATLIIHLSDDALTTGVGIGRCEQLGPVTIEQIRTLLGHTRVTVRPVFNPNGIAPVDAYEIPAPMRRAVLMRHPWEVFPFSGKPSAGLDLDHTRPYGRGRHFRPGQTDPDNLGPLRRKVHRGKTHSEWRLTQPEPGWFIWVSPLGRRYVVTPAGLTNDYRHAPGSSQWDNPLGGPLLPELPQRHRKRTGLASPTLRGRAPVIRR